ncbi:MAG: acyl carrier protein [Clostridia bacterium]|nr:acyl carrier protein [Clostridia bacterium]MBQ7046680.1 acyl carrier protein [Oscillospiraceae bacterium]
MDIFETVRTTALEMSALDSVEGSNLKEDYGLDSLSVTMLIVKLEEKFNIEINLGLLTQGNIQTIDGICDIVKKSLEG